MNAGLRVSLLCVILLLSCSAFVDETEFETKTTTEQPTTTTTTTTARACEGGGLNGGSCWYGDDDGDGEGVWDEVYETEDECREKKSCDPTLPLRGKVCDPDGQLGSTPSSSQRSCVDGPGETDVLCPGLAQSDFCDCGVDCMEKNHQPRWSSDGKYRRPENPSACQCTDAQACCQDAIKCDANYRAFNEIFRTLCNQISATENTCKGDVPLYPGNVYGLTVPSFSEDQEDYYLSGLEVLKYIMTLSTQRPQGFTDNFEVLFGIAYDSSDGSHEDLKSAAERAYPGSNCAPLDEIRGQDDD